MSALSVIWLGAIVLGLIDALRHSSADWAYADRNKAFWVIFIAFFGPLFAIPYVFLVRTRFPGAAARDDERPFLKD